MVCMKGMFEIHIPKVLHSLGVTRKQIIETEETDEESRSEMPECWAVFLRRKKSP